MTTNHSTCNDRIAGELTSRIDDLFKLWTAYQEGDEMRYVDQLGTFSEYGLSFDYVEPDTYEGQREGYFRYQLSWGGPSDEFRFFTSPDLSCHCIEYWFLDWFDGAKITLKNSDERLLLEIWEFFREIGSAKSALLNAMEDCS